MYNPQILLIYFDKYFHPSSSPRWMWGEYLSGCEVATDLVHNCIIFLYPLDVGWSMQISRYKGERSSSWENNYHWPRFFPSTSIGLISPLHDPLSTFVMLIELKIIFQNFSSSSLLSFYLPSHLTSFHKLLAVWGGLSSASAHNLVPWLHNFFWNVKKEALYVNQGAYIDNVEFKGWMLKPIRGWALSRLTYVLIKLSTFS